MMKNAQGFTLLEVVVCVAVVAIMFAVALPDLTSFRESAEQKEAAREVLAALRLARNAAISHNREYQVAFDLDSGSYWLEEGDSVSDSSSWDRVKELGRFPAGLKMATKANCQCTTGDGDPSTADNMIQFNPNGTCGAHGSAVARYICVLSTENEKKYRCGVPSSITGRAIIDRL